MLWLFLSKRYKEGYLYFISSRRWHTRYIGDWSSDVCSSDLGGRWGCWGRNDRYLRSKCPQVTIVSAPSIPSVPRLSGERGHAGVTQRHQGRALINAWCGQIGRASCRERVVTREGGRMVKEKV